MIFLDQNDAHIQEHSQNNCDRECGALALAAPRLPERAGGRGGIQEQGARFREPECAAVPREGRVPVVLPEGVLQDSDVEARSGHAGRRLGGVHDDLDDVWQTCPSKARRGIRFLFCSLRNIFFVFPRVNFAKEDLILGVLVWKDREAAAGPDAILFIGICTNYNRLIILGRGAINLL